MTRKLYFTVDADRDANIPIPGRVAAGSIDRGSGTGPRFSSSERGMSVLAELLDDIGIRGTFFMEGRTAEVTGCSVLSGHCIGLHGYDHEDLLGRETGIVPDVEDVLRRGYDAVSDVLSRPTCFRAPYMAADDRVLETVRSLGIRADSSFYTDVGGPTDPYELQGMTEFPVPKARDAGGKVIAAYLWPMHEGRRVPEDYIRMADIQLFRQMNEQSKLVIIPGASHRFLEDGAWDMVLDLTRDWFEFEQVLCCDWE